MDDRQTTPGLCECGCGVATPVFRRTDRSRGRVKGEHARFIKSHSARTKAGRGYEERDCGYETPCWVWLGSISHKGYGQHNRGPGSKAVHVQNWTEVNGPVPDGFQLDHLCRVRACVNPDHLEPVTQTENLRRGRSTKLTIDAVREIRASSDSPALLASRFGVSRSCIYMVRNSHGWEDVKPTMDPQGRSTRAKLTAADVREIRASEDSPLMLAEKHGVSRAAIYSILHRRTWKDIP